MCALAPGDVIIVIVFQWLQTVAVFEEAPGELISKAFHDYIFFKKLLTFTRPPVRILIEIYPLQLPLCTGIDCPLAFGIIFWVYFVVDFSMVANLTTSRVVIVVGNHPALMLRTGYSFFVFYFCACVPWDIPFALLLVIMWRLTTMAFEHTPV